MAWPLNLDSLHSEGHTFKENKQKGHAVKFLKVILFFKRAKTNKQEKKPATPLYFILVYF